MKSFIKILFYTLSCIIFFNKSLAQPNKHPIELLHADVTQGSDSNGSRLREFIGKVGFRQGNVRLFCDKAIQDLDLFTITLIGNVKVMQDDMILTSPKINYNGNNGLAESFVNLKIQDKNVTLVADKGKYSTKSFIADFINNVKIDDDTVHIKADTISYNRITRISDAWGNVKIDDDSMLVFAKYINYNRPKKDSKAFGRVYIKHKNRKSVLICDTLYNLNSEQYSIAFGNPTLFFLDSTKNSLKIDTSIIKSDTIEALTPKGQEQFIFKKNVELIREKIAAKCELMKYFRSVEMIELNINPILWVDSTQLHSDSISIRLEKNKLKHIESNNNSILISRDDTLDFDLINQISGNNIKMLFENDSIKFIRAYGNSKSLYFVRNDDGSLAASRNASENLEIIFEEGKPGKIDWIGKVNGEYYPENLFSGGVQKFYLPLFKIRYDKPKKIKLTNRE